MAAGAVPAYWALSEVGIWGFVSVMTSGNAGYSMLAFASFGYLASAVMLATLLAAPLPTAGSPLPA